MSKKIGKRQENLLAKIANLVGKDVEEVKQAATGELYTEEENMYVMQSVYNYYVWRTTPERKQGETKDEYEARLNSWKTKRCKGCDELFAYSYVYDGVQFCSYDCLRKELRGIGLEFTPGRPLNLRWGYRMPGIVSASALSAVESSLAASSFESLGNDG